MLRGHTVRSQPLTVATALVLLAAGCASDDVGADVEVRPIDDIIEGEIEVTPDVSGTFATLELTTTVDVVCSVAYGPDETFGMIATDDDMAGGGHRDHRPTLDGLAPETTYSFVLQGADAGGTLYRSEVMEFTTPTAAPAQTPGRNMATDGTVVDVSSEFSAAFAAANAIDGDRSTAWSSDGDGDDAFVTIDLGRQVEIVGAGFLTRSMGDGSATTTSYTVTVDPDGAAEQFGPFEVGDGLSVAEFTTTGRVVRFDAEATTGGNTGAVEVEVYAAD